MKTLRSSILCLVVLVLVAPLLRAQDLSKYRHFTLGMNLTKLLERTEQKMTDVKTIRRLISSLASYYQTFMGKPLLKRHGFAARSVVCLQNE